MTGGCDGNAAWDPNPDIVLDSDGTRRVVETFVQGRPSHHDPPAGTAHTTLEEQKRLQRTTLHLIQSRNRPVAQR